MLYKVDDDSGLLAIVDPDAYRGFVHADWTGEMLSEHFTQAMRAGHLLIWFSGLEHRWNVEVCLRPAAVTGFREISGSINATQGRLLLTSYDSLTMAAQFADFTLPEAREQAQVLAVPPGLHHCRIIQMSDPESDRPFAELVNFVYEILPAASPHEVWGEIPWPQT